MQIKRVIGPKGQLVIPKDLRDYLGIKVGDTVTFEVREGLVILKPGKTPEEAVEDYIAVVKNKLKAEVDMERVIEEEALERVVLRRQ